MAKEYLKDTILSVNAQTDLDKKILLVDTKGQAYPFVYNGTHSYQIVKTGNDYAIYPQVVNEDQSGVENAKDPIVFTGNNTIFFTVRRESAPYFDLVSKEETLNSWDNMEQQVLEAFIAYVRSHFTMGKPYILLTDDEYYEPEAHATGISLDQTTLTGQVGGTAKLNATLTPAGTSDTVLYSSSDSTVATVDNAGNVAYVKAGTATISATLSSDSSKVATCAVTVTAE